MLVAFCSDKGSPGTTTTALAVASAWPHPALLVEADPFGGDLAIRLRTSAGLLLPEAPTVLSLATAARTGSGSGARSGGQGGAAESLVRRHAQPLNPHLSVVPGHLVAEQITGVTEWAPLAVALAVSDTPVFVDIGRVHSASPLLPVAARADVVVVVTRPDHASVIRLRERLCRLIPALATARGATPTVMVALVSPLRHGPGHTADLQAVMAETTAGPLIADVGFIASDPATVIRLQNGERRTGRIARTPLLRTATALAAQISHLVPARAHVPMPAAPRNEVRTLTGSPGASRTGSSPSPAAESAAGATAPMPPPTAPAPATLLPVPEVSGSVSRLLERSRAAAASRPGTTPPLSPPPTPAQQGTVDAEVQGTAQSGIQGASGPASAAPSGRGAAPEGPPPVAGPMARGNLRSVAGGSGVSDA